MKKEKKQNGIIYKVENTENGMIYIGATFDELHKRKSDHLCKAKLKEVHKFQEAINTFGEDAFEWAQIDTAPSPNELAAKEKEYIIEYNSKEEGYNSDVGGGIKKTIYQYSISDGNLIDSYKGLEDAGNAINVTDKAISKTCLSVNQTLKGFYWSYEYREPYIPNFDNRKKEVVQYDLDGNLIAKYISVSEASKQTKVNKTSIAKVCRGLRNHAGEYIWIYK